MLIYCIAEMCVHKANRYKKLQAAANQLSSSLDSSGGRGKDSTTCFIRIPIISSYISHSDTVASVSNH